MIKLNLKTLFLGLLVSVAFVSCSEDEDPATSDDTDQVAALLDSISSVVTDATDLPEMPSVPEVIETPNTDVPSGCGDLLDQDAQGTFIGEAFAFVQGTVSEDSFDAGKYDFILYGASVTGEACDDFNFSKPRKTIRFSVPLAVGKYTIDDASNALRFNDASVTNTANVDYASCGTIYIDAITETSVTGRVLASGESSAISGNFELEKCAD